ncbi:MAG: NYN domain-containing protein [Acidobacteria bacterium]|nr:NYN domain-containing protein [Acidobacteriota bacterium]
MNGDSNLAVFCDFENIALGVRDAKLKKIDIRPIVERLLLKGSIVAKKAYCDWERYKEHKPTMHEAAFELIEIPHTRISGKNSADIRMVVDALDLCYTKEHIDTFVIVSGDSDFSPLVSKLRENAKSVIGVGVKSSTSDLLMNNCDEFIFYDDLVAERKPARRRARSKPRAKAEGPAESAPAESAPAGKNGKKPEPAPQDDPAQKGLDLVVQTAEAIFAERGDGAKLWGSMIKQTLKRRRPGFSESAYGFGSFNDLLEEAQSRGLLDLDRDERSGGYVITGIGRE